MKNIKTAVGLREEAHLFRVWSFFVESGIPVLNGIRLLADMFPNFNKTLLAIGEAVKQGEDMRTSFGGQEHFFSEWVPSLVDCGTNSGLLHETLFEASRIAEGTRRLAQAGAPTEKISEVNFYRLLVFFANAGCSVLSFLKQAANVYLPAEVIANVCRDIDNGATLSESMGKYPTYFSADDVGMIATGELSGDLGEVAKQLAQIKERKLFMSAETFRQVRTEPKDTAVLLEFSQLRVLVDAGIPVVEALKLVGRNAFTPARKAALNSVREKIIEGLMLSEAVASLPSDFPSYVVPVIHAGELGGMLEKSLGLIIRQMKWEFLGID